MAYFLHAFSLLLISRLVIAQSAAPSAASSAAPSVVLSAAPSVVPSAMPTTVIDTAASDLGILQLVTPTTHADQVPMTALYALTTDAANFVSSYIQIDPFDFGSALDLAIQSQPGSAAATLWAGVDRLDLAYAEFPTSLLYNPTAYLSRLHDSISGYPSAFSSSAMSQVTGVLLGYESIVSQDVLSKNSSSGPITPGMSIAVGAALTSVSTMSSTMGTMQASQASQGMGTAPTTSSSKAAGVPMMTASPLLMINAAAAAVGVLGVALM